MNLLEMFSGIGGFRLGMEQAGFKFDWVGYSEIDKYAKDVYKKHWKESEDLGDATTINEHELPRIDMLVGGFPCQSFSIAGKRKGFDDTRGTLFYDIARIVKEKRPKIIFLENVRGLLSHDNGRTFETIIRILGDLGYIVQWQVLNSKHFGVPQNRERVFIIGHTGRECFRKIFPIGEDGSSTNERYTKGVQQTANTIRARDYASWRGNHLKELTTNQSQGYRVYDPNGLSTTLASEAGGLGAKTGLYRIKNKNGDGRLHDYNDICQCLEAGTSGGGGTNNRPMVKVHSLQPRSGDPKKGGTGPLNREDGNTYCLDTGNTQGIETNSRIRRLTPIECARLQGFPDNWCEGLSDTQQYKCYGNAVTVNVIKAIAKNILESEL